VWRWLVYQVVKLYERDQYVDFVHADLGSLLARSGISIHGEHRALLGAARVVIGVREE
jgi:hypothetical protein